jgi:hypothetical protein
MARVPGLTSFDEDRPGSVRRSKGRVQAPSPSQMPDRRLSPVASPVDTYARPEAPPIGSNGWLSLAESLQSIQPSIGRFLKATEPEENDSIALARKYLQTTPKEQVEKDLKEGKAHPLANAKGMEVYGEYRRYADLEEVTRRINEGEFDPATGDIDSLFREVTSNSFKQFGNDRAFLRTYTEGLQNGWDKIKAGVNDIRSKKVMEQRTDTVFDTWHKRINFMSAEGKTPDEVAASVYADFTSNKDLLGLDFKDQQGMALQLADQFATQGKFNEAKALLKYERENGSYKGSLLSDKDLGQRATDLLGRIEAEELKARLKAQAAEAEAQLDGALLSKVQDGTITAVTDVQVPDEQGELKTYTPEQLRKRAAKIAVENSAARAAYSKETPEQTYAREVREFAGSGLEHPQWFTVINSGFATATVNNLTGDKLPPALEDGYEMYKRLQVDAPQYVGKHTEKKALDFYEAARVAEQDLGFTDRKAALMAAHRATRDPAENDTLTNQTFQNLDDAVDRAVSSYRGFFNFGGVFGGDGENLNTAKSEIAKYAKVYARMGVATEKSLELAQERFTKNHINVLGTFIRNDPRMPNDFQDLVTFAAQDFLAKHGSEEGLDDLDDITIIPTGNGVGGYYIARRGDLMPFAEYPDATLTVSTLEALRAKRRAEAEAEVVKNRNAKNK